MYFNPMETSLTRTAVRAWVETAKALRDAHKSRLGGVIVHIQSPHVMSDGEIAVIRHVDRFLRAHEQYPVSTVANTIFPQSLDFGDGAEALAERYMKTFRRSMNSGWGRYFERFVAWPNPKGGKPINQLAIVIKMLSEARTGVFHTEKYELVVSDPARLMRNVRNRPCLSLVELKPEKDTNLLHIYATYRNHYYVQKTLGNILGLVDLQAFIAREAGFEVGTLTLNSTSANLETSPGKKGVGKWGKNDVRKLVTECDDLLARRRAA
ncbi:MAG: hypothetical protein F4186_12940 [Boseongicola sp. SB0676_bin_33]|uniref:Thymidylate synthase n=1 Tax=Boseongicola sp. SB0664_bin_43 TaxID=2604844 RepID=A0A6B0XVY2_9RHOB|nr:hypothetical protein [Boseongicola sp. SB0664_bin_43]MYF90143.1 hypothetical protein [Boseongicola sp. SB0676_bin_33]